MVRNFDRRGFMHSAAAGLNAVAWLGVGACAAGKTREDAGLQSFSVPSWTPVNGGNVETVVTTNSFLSQNGRLPGWEYAFGKIVDDYSGGVFNPYWGRLGAMVFHGGGHSATFDNSVVILDLNDLTFKRLSDPTPSKQGKNWISTTGGPQTTDPAFDLQHGEYGDGQPGAGHTYDTLGILPPADGGARFGSLIRVAGFALHVNLSANAGWAHRFDFPSTAMRDGTWSRWSVNGASSYLSPGACSAYDARRKRFWWISGLSSAPPLIRYLDAATRQQVEVGISSATGLAPPAQPDSSTMRYDARRDVLVLTCTVADELVLAFLDCANPDRGWHKVTLSERIPAVANTSQAFDWVPEMDCWVLLSAADPSAVYEITPPRLVNANWAVVRRPLGGSGSLTTARVVGKRWSYAPAAKAFVWMARSTSAVVAYRPFGV